MNATSPPPPRAKSALTAAFTLIEISIVLVIIGLIVGGVLVGQDLIRAAAVRAQITQIEKYNTAVNSFYGKFGYLPGDINADAAAQFGFLPRGTSGMGDGNGIIEGNYCACGGTGQVSGFYTAGGEVVVFWVDLSTAGLIDNALNTANYTSGDPRSLVITGTTISLYLPRAKIGQGNYLYVWSGGFWTGATGDATNYFGLSAVTDLVNGGATRMSSNPGLSVKQAYGIDSKIDDGLPQSGRVMAWDLHINGGNYFGASWRGALPGTATTPTSSTCYDNGNNASSPMNYSMGQIGGSGVNCSLSFRFQ